VSVDGQTVSGPGPDRGVVFQQGALFPWRTVLDNVIFGLEVQGKRKRESRERADGLIKLVGLSGFDTTSRTSYQAACANAPISPAR
jgi:NitT/TauT family transport system ATP-binding protein